MSAAQQIDSFSTETASAGADPANASVATRRVLDMMTRTGVPFFLKLLPEGVHTPEQVAELCNCELDFIVQSTVFRGKTSKKPFLLLSSSATKLSDRNIGTMVGENLQRADSDFSLRLTGYPNGAVPPLCHLNRIPVMMDSALMRFPRVWCPAGATNAIVSIPTLVLARAVSARVVRLD